MSLVEGSSALQQTVEVAETLKVVSESTQQTAEIYSISQYLTETQSDQPQAAFAAWKYVESLQAYVPQVVTGLTATAGGAYAAVSGGLAYVLSVPAAFCAIAGALGVGVGVGMYQLNPEFWETASNALVEAGCMVGNGVLAIVKDGKNYIPETTIDVVKQVLIDAGAYRNIPESTLDIGSTVDFSCNLSSFSSFIYDVFNTSFEQETGLGDWSDFTKQAFLTGITWLLNNAPSLPANCFYCITWTLTSTGLPYNYVLRLYVLEKPSGTYTVIEGVTNTYFRNHDNTPYRFQISPGAVYNIVEDILVYSFSIYDNRTSNNYYAQPETSVESSGGTKSSGINTYNAFSPCYINEMGRTTLSLYGFDIISGSGVEGLEKEQGATYPDETKTIPEEYPNWANDGMTFLRPKTREIGENPVLDPDNVEEVRALPVEIPAIEGNPANEGLEEGQQVEQGGVIDAPPVVGPVPPPWKRIIVGVDDMIDVDPPKPPLEDDPPILNVPENTDPPIEDPPVDPPTDNGGVTPAVIPPTDGANTGMNNVYNPTKAEMREFNAFLWSNDFIDTIKKILNDPMQAVIALQIVYVTPPTESGHTIVVGAIDTEVSSDIVTSQYVSVNCGSVSIPEYFKDYTDYSPYTQVSCYLPFIGFVQLDTDDIVGSTVSIEYTVDLFTGACLAEITVTKGNMSAVLYTFNGNCAVQLPLTSATHSSIVGTLTGVSTALLGVSTGNPLLALGGIASAGMSYAKNDISRSGSLGSNAGAMGIKKPYILVRRPVAYNAERYNEYIGIPSNKTVVLSTLTGYTRVQETHVENIAGATDREKDMILTQLKQGVIL